MGLAAPGLWGGSGPTQSSADIQLSENRVIFEQFRGTSPALPDVITYQGEHMHIRAILVVALIGHLACFAGPGEIGETSLNNSSVEDVSGFFALW